MVSIHPLYSSSSGNMFHLESRSTNILIDAGVSYKAIKDGLNNIDKDISDISAILITHEHIDHIKGIPLLCRKNNIPIYACGKTADYLQEMLDEKNIQSEIYKINYGQPFMIKNIEVTPFETSHDALMPCGFKIKTDNISIAYATDLGYVSNEVLDNLRDSDYTILESNYDTTMLDFGSYPFNTKRRIKSNLGHLSNEESAKTISHLAKNGQNRFLLAHLSTNNNHEQTARDTINSILMEHDIDPSTLELNFASKDLSSEEFCIC